MSKPEVDRKTNPHDEPREGLSQVLPVRRRETRSPLLPLSVFSYVVKRHSKDLPEVDDPPLEINPPDLTGREQVEALDPALKNLLFPAATRRVLELGDEFFLGKERAQHGSGDLPCQEIAGLGEYYDIVPYDVGLNTLLQEVAIGRINGHGWEVEEEIALFNRAVSYRPIPRIVAWRGLVRPTIGHRTTRQSPLRQ